MPAVVLGLLLVGATALVGWLPFWWAAVALGVAHTAYLTLAYRLVAARRRPSWRPTFVVAVTLAVAVRAVCLPHPPVFSDDIYRYLHEGALVLAGQNPYAVAPQDVAPELRGATWSQINNPDIPAAYPPAVQYALALGVWLSPQPIGVKSVFGLLDLLVFLVLWRALPRWSVPREYALLYGACPLLAVEFAGQGHSDSLAVLAMTLSAWAVAARAPVRGAVALAVATAGKLVPIVLLPWVLRGIGSRARCVVAVLAFVATVAVLYAPFLGDPAALLYGTEQYSRRWSSNASLFVPVLAVAQAVESVGWLSGFELTWLREGQGLAKLPLLGAGVVLLIVCWWRRLALPWVALWFFTFFVACAPTVHPWYVAMLVPWLCFAPNPGLLVFSGSVFLAYHVLPQWHSAGVWQESTWIKVIEYLPFYLGVLWTMSRTVHGVGGSSDPRIVVAGSADEP